MTECQDVMIPRERLWWMLLSNLRYSMGRMSTAPQTTSEMIKGYAYALTGDQLRQMWSEIHRELTISAHAGETLGMQCDHDVWLELADWLYHARKKRNQHDT